MVSKLKKVHEVQFVFQQYTTVIKIFLLEPNEIQKYI